MKALFWWLRHDRIGRSRLVVFVLAVLAVVGWAVFGWPTAGNAAVGIVGALVIVFGDYFFWRSDLRKAGEPVPGRDESGRGR
jgi:hypothetical protein